MSCDTAIISCKPNIAVYSRPNIQEGLDGVYEKVDKILVLLEQYWGVDYPLSKLDLVALPGMSSVKPADNWGLILLK